jgi:hypothetical protein
MSQSQQRRNKTLAIENEDLRTIRRGLLAQVSMHEREMAEAQAAIAALREQLDGKNAQEVKPNEF